MDFLNLALFWLHFMALALGGVASFGIPLLATRMPGADPAARPALGQAIQRFRKSSPASTQTLLANRGVKSRLTNPPERK